VEDTLEQRTLIRKKLSVILANKNYAFNVEMNGMDILHHAKKQWKKSSKDGHQAI